MTSSRTKDPYGFVPVTEPVRAHPQPIPERSHEKPDLPCGKAFDPVQVVFLAVVYFGAAKLGLTMAFVVEQVTVVALAQSDGRGVRESMSPAPAVGAAAGGYNSASAAQVRESGR
jgi:hypothetical protein